MKRLMLAIAAVSLLAGCTHTRTFDTASPDARAELNARAAGETTTLTLRSGESVSARSVSVAPDKTTWIDPATTEVHSVPTREVETVRFDSRGRGALEGLGVGAAIGVGVGVLVGTVIGATDDGSFIDFTPAEAALGMGILSGGAGAGVGGAAGTIRQSRTVYDPALPPQSSPEQTEGDVE